MALDYIVVGFSSVILIFYFITIFMLMDIRRRLSENMRISFTLIILSLFVLTIRRLQQVFLESTILSPIPYSSDIITLIFILLFFLGVLTFYRNVKKAAGSRGSSGASFSSYKKNLGRKIIR